MIVVTPPAVSSQSLFPVNTIGRRMISAFDRRFSRSKSPTATAQCRILPVHDSGEGNSSGE
ncbi:hypothetical protein JCGZ_12735 [Jatropha curcas]|uniref:Uncharacterized protein n=1 Tax=Jatropha curcas TaxID=180498 RepID=A0A067KE21_JATCU|nr:hypothetical protein JCGZ_12735 [Jatropha curcas]